MKNSLASLIIKFNVQNSKFKVISWSFGPEQVVGYLTAEEGNTMAVRMVLTGLLAGIDPERLKERLRESYV